MEHGRGARPETNIRTWGQLGLQGEWANAQITPYGPPALHPGGVSFFQSRVMGGAADVWNERLREYPDRSAMLRALANVRYGIAYASLGYAAPGAKTLALAERDGGPYFQLDAKTVSSRAYPLSRFVYMYLAPDTVAGDAARLSPNLRAFLEFVLRRDGQQLASATSYYPLPVGIASKQLANLRANPLPRPTAKSS
ncbi:MAG: PstS [Phenylobacterium sp.]|nr:PstS [Phenylobacterium sp.]MDB5465369.1 PstS [Phenylobacterium sp.]